MAPTINDMTEDDIFLDNIKGIDNSDNSNIVTDFMPTARDIMNWSPLPMRIR